MWTGLFHVFKHYFTCTLCFSSWLKPMKISNHLNRHFTDNYWTCLNSENVYLLPSETITLVISEDACVLFILIFRLCRHLDFGQELLTCPYILHLGAPQKLAFSLMHGPYHLSCIFPYLTSGTHLKIALWTHIYFCLKREQEVRLNLFFIL